MIPIVHGKTARPDAITLTPDSDVVMFLTPYALAEDPITADMLIHSSTISKSDRIEMLTTLASRWLENCIGKIYDAGNSWHGASGNLVRIPGSHLWMGVTEVTQRQYEAVTKKNPSAFKNPEGPVEEVTWIQSVKFCNLMSDRADLEPAYKIIGGHAVRDEDANGYRLPTTEEWLMAASTGESQHYSGSDKIEEVGWVISNSKMRPHPVMQLKPNAHGIYDMMGNVFEWGWDTPMDQNRSILGGSWMTDGYYCLLSQQLKYIEPTKKMPWIGFRICRTEVVV